MQVQVVWKCLRDKAHMRHVSYVIIHVFDGGVIGYVSDSVMHTRTCFISNKGRTARLQ
jgi:hypothetical protein